MKAKKHNMKCGFCTSTWYFDSPSDWIYGVSTLDCCSKKCENALYKKITKALNS